MPSMHNQEIYATKHRVLLFGLSYRLARNKKRLDLKKEECLVIISKDLMFGTMCSRVGTEKEK